MTQRNMKDTAIAVESRIYAALGGLYELEGPAAIDIAGRISLQMAAIVGDAISQDGSPENRRTAKRFIEDALADLLVLKKQVDTPALI